MPIVLVGSSSVTTVGFKDGLVNKIRQRDVTLYIEHQKKKKYIGNNWTVIKHFFVKLQLAVTLYLLYSQVGVAFLAGLVFSVVLIPINKLIANKIGDLSTKLMEQKDKRVKIITEVLRGIKAVKLYVWEDHFLRLISRTYARHFNPIRFVIKNDIYRFKPSGYYTSPLELIGISLVLLFQTWNIEIIFFFDDICRGSKPRIEIPERQKISGRPLRVLLGHHSRCDLHPYIHDLLVARQSINGRYRFHRHGVTQHAHFPVKRIPVGVERYDGGLGQRQENPKIITG